jgi:hypothetical protein
VTDTACRLLRRLALVLALAWTPHAAADEQLGTEAALQALSLVGVGYRLGGEDAAGGFDCSGLVRHVLARAAGAPLPRSAREQSRAGRAVGRHELRAGDLVFFGTLGSANSHVGIYVGEGRFVHAPGQGRTVSVGSLDASYWRRHYSGARRIVGETALASALPARESLASAAQPSLAHHAMHELLPQREQP